MNVDTDTLEWVASTLGERVDAVSPLSQGGNNRVYRVTAGSQSALLKEYFRHPDDTRDRLASEYAFCRYADEVGVREVPRPLGHHDALGVGLYEFIDGTAIEPGTVEPGDIRAAAQFVRNLNGERSRELATQLPMGAEACRTIRDHFDIVSRRLDRLAALEPATPLHKEAVTFVSNELRPLYESLTATPDPCDSPCELVLSPSDFGFHNALRTADGTLRFVDFEYAGWDDPAKLVCDFYSQVKVPVPQESLEEFVQRIASLLDTPQTFRHRVAVLLPLYRIKWCCIVLNVFLPQGSARRTFSGVQLDDAVLLAQLKLARALQRAVECKLKTERKMPGVTP